MFTRRNKRHRALLLLLLGLSFVAGLSFSPQCNDGVWEVFYDQETYFNCTVEGEVEWTLRLSGYTSPITLAVCDKNCNILNTFEGLYTARITDIHKTTMIIKPKNNRKVYDNVELVNGRLECSHGDDDTGCGLNLVDPPANVSCKATNSSWSINVSCVIGSVYSSRKIYTCTLIRTQTSKNETVENVTMVTFPTRENITKSEVKVSGFCHFNTTLPTEEGHYGFIVSFSPGARNFITDNKQFTVERPRSPAVSCGPQPYILEHTTLTCTCYTPSLGQPEGYLRWVSGNQTNQGTVVKQQQLPSKELRYNQVLILSDHNNTWFRCDVFWGTEEIRGENYTASVGFSPGHLDFYHPAIIYGVVCLIVIIFASVVLIVVIRKLKKSKGDQSSQTPGEAHQTPLESAQLKLQPLEANFTADTSGLVPCQMPVYAVVDKTRKKTICQPAYIAEAADEREEGMRNAAQGVSVSNSRLPDNTESEYAVLEVFRGKTSARHDKDYKHKKQELRTNTMQGILADDDDFKIYDHLTTQPLPPQQDCNIRRDVPCPASHSHAEDDGSWATDDDLMYLTSSCDVSYDAKRHPPPRPKERKY